MILDLFLRRMCLEMLLETKVGGVVFIIFLKKIKKVGKKMVIAFTKSRILEIYFFQTQNIILIRELGRV